MKLPHLKSKSKKTAILRKHSALSKHVPPTHPFSRARLYSMTMQYGTVYAKPDMGRFGKGIIKIQRQANDFQLQYLSRSREYDTFQSLYSSIKKIKGPRKYILQQGIHMTIYRNRPFDIRIMVQLSPSNTWETTGILARVAAPGKIVTNFHSGGTAHPLLPLLSEYTSINERKKILRYFASFGCKVARHYQKHIRGLKEIGIDVALDHQLKPWILEINTRPDALVFKELKNKTMFRKIIRYARRYGKYRGRRL